MGHSDPMEQLSGVRFEQTPMAKPTLPIVNGVLMVKLVLTTTATPERAQ